MRVLEAAGLRLNVCKQNFCLIDGSLLQTTRREFCLWWLRSFENAGNVIHNQVRLCHAQLEYPTEYGLNII